MDPLAIANLALGWLGAEPIASLEDATRTAQIVNNAFAGLRDAVLEDGDWTFATKRMTLPASAVQPGYGTGTFFELPSEVLRVQTCCLPGNATGSLDAFALSHMDPGDGELDWSVEGRFVLTPTTTSPAWVKAIVRVEDSRTWSPGFCQSLAARLASDLAVPLADNRSLQADLWKLYEGKLRDARFNDGRQGRSQRIRTSAINIRRR